MMKQSIWLIFLAIFISCKQEPTKTYTLQDDVAFLASDSLMGRETGTENELMAADYPSENVAQVFNTSWRARRYDIGSHGS